MTNTSGHVPSEQWRPMETAPKDGTLLRLLVEFEHHATEDGEGPQPTIGSNTWDNHHDFDEWQFAGWDWCQDRYTQGVGKPVGWLPLLGTAPAAPKSVQPADPMGWPLPCGIKVGHVTISKGVALRTLVRRMEVLYSMATGRAAHQDEVPSEAQYLCQAWGETDYPVVAIVTGLGAVSAFLVEMWLGDADGKHDDGTKALPAALADMQEEWKREGDTWKWSIEFEIGGISVQKVWLTAPRALAGHEKALTQAECDVLAERSRQINEEGYDPAHDDEYVNDEIAAMAALYVMPEGARDWDTTSTGYGDTLGAAMMPADWDAPRFGHRRQQLVKGAAMALAEIERLDRDAARKGDVA
ncbi:hypothetical protein [Acidovorax sp. SUPP2825]|uniref:hypothetical protein n=1 Tax=Acidovorax sp. SUPP2825 TaxID=2920879 RepID=UPI0023DE51A5|nr:hypothetical protein [Acidovorax sp. SUPP2825]GKS96917.1 hypothetical protein AVAK2825_20300 [Acidovorax sp. SUPP2825]